VKAKRREGCDLLDGGKFAQGKRMSYQQGLRLRDAKKACQSRRAEVKSKYFWCHGRYKRDIRTMMKFGGIDVSNILSLLSLLG